MTHEMTLDEMDWYQHRLGRYTASEIWKLLPPPKSRLKKENGLSTGAMTYIKTKVSERLTMQVKPQIDFKQAEWGKEYEPVAVNTFEKATGIRGTHYGVSNPQFFEYGEYAGGSPDWISLDESEGADIKCPFNTSEHVSNLLLQSGDDLKNEHWDYYCQGQFLMHMKNWERFYFVSYDPRPIEPKYRLKILVIYPDDVWVAEFKARLNEAIITLNAMMANLDYVISNKKEVAA